MDADPGAKASRSDDGSVLVLAAALLVVLMGFAALAVDVGLFYWTGNQAQRTAEASALAAVVHMPRAGGPWSGSEAYTTAMDVSKANGFDDTATNVTVTPEEFADPLRRNQVRVTVSKTVPTIFARIFGQREQTLTRSAVAEQLPPLRLGSDQPTFGGDDPATGNPDVNFWAAVNGEFATKENGDPYSTRCTNDNTNRPSQSGVGCDDGNVGNQFRDPAYYYAVEVPGSDAGSVLNVDVWDAAYYSPGIDGNFGGGVTLFTTTYQLMRPDSTPGNPLDNSVAACPAAAFPARTSDGPGDGVAEWATVCGPITAEAGIYVLRVQVDNGGGGNGFAVRASTGGPGSPQVYGVGSMSIWTISPGVTASFKVARVDEVYRGRPLTISLFDPGDVRQGTAPPGWEAEITIAGDGTGVPCDIRVLSEDLTFERSEGTRDPCTIITAADGLADPDGKMPFNNRWLEITFDVPDTYACSVANACWWTVLYTFDAGVTNSDRTTWDARVGGSPIRLINDPGP